tara:strand:- start:267 stop:1091 length:825 start_codon:yes stop_codon:yes gene_type:complete
VKLKHNKKRNTAFLYEVLIKELTKSIFDKELARKRFISGLIKESFGANSILGRELEYYKTLLETTGIEPYLAEKLLQETKMAHALLDSKGVFDAQTRVINKINRALSKDVWNTFVPNFKSLATIDTVFNRSVSIKQRVLHEDMLIKLMNSPAKLQENKLEPIDNIIYRSFVQKFNTKYGALLSEQRDLLGKYIASFSDNGLELKIYLNEEIGRLRALVEKSLKMEEVITDEKMVKKTKQVLDMLEGFRGAAPTQKVVSKILNIQQLVEEIKSND